MNSVRHFGSSWRALACVLCTVAALSADNGDVLSVSNVLAGTPLVDITQDSRNGSYWVLGANGSTEAAHRIYNMSAGLTELADPAFIENPHPAGVLPSITTNRGLAFNSFSRTLFILALVREGGTPSYVIRETDPDQVVDPPEFAGAVINVTGAGANANLHGLAFDGLAREFWTLDSINETALRIDMDGNITASFAIARDGADVRGRGIAQELAVEGEAVLSRVYTTFGDIFRNEPSQVVVWNSDTGERTGVEVPLTKVPAVNLAGFHVSQAGFQKNIVVTTGGGEIYRVAVVPSDPVPPAELVCSLTLANAVEISWKNHGNDANRSYGAIQVIRNGIPLTTVAGDATSFLDSTPVEGISTYSLRASNEPESEFGAESTSCTITVGTGGLVNWITGPGTAIFDIARDPTTGKIFATGMDGAEPKIYVFDSRLELLGEVPSPWIDPHAITFVPSLNIVTIVIDPDTGLPVSTRIELSDTLVVCRRSGNQVRFIDVAGAVRLTTTLDLAAESPMIGALTYLQDQERFALMEVSGSAPSEYRINILETDGSLAQSCEPSFLIGIPFDVGLAFDPLRATMLTAFEGGVVRELFAGPSCPGTDEKEFPPIDLASLGEGYDREGFIGGIEIAENTLLVAGLRTNAIYRTLIFPFENSFIRGDVDMSGAVEVTDAVGVANYLFRPGEPEPPCLDSADANDDGLLDISDPVSIVFFLFLGADAPPAPYPNAGRDPTFRDNIGCSQ